MSVYVSTSDEVAVAKVAKKVTNEQGMLNDVFQSFRTGERLNLAKRIGREQRTASTLHTIVRVNGQEMRRYHSIVVSAAITGIAREGDSYTLFTDIGEMSLHSLAFTVRMVNPDRVKATPGQIADED